MIFCSARYSIPLDICKHISSRNDWAPETW